MTRPFGSSPPGAVKALLILLVVTVDSACLAQAVIRRARGAKGSGLRQLIIALDAGSKPLLVPEEGASPTESRRVFQGYVPL